MSAAGSVRKEAVRLRAWRDDFTPTATTNAVPVPPARRPLQPLSSGCLILHRLVFHGGFVELVKPSPLRANCAPPAMPSHLSRVVFRSLIADRPLLYCARIAPLSRPPRPRGPLRHAFRTLAARRQQWGIFDLFKPQRKIKPARVPAGLETMAELARNQEYEVRPPPPRELAHALKAFFAQKDVCFEDFHVTMAVNAFRYLLENPREDGQPWLTTEDIHKMLEAVVLQRPQSVTKHHLLLGREFHAELRRLMDQEEEQAGGKGSNRLSSYETKELPNLVQLLSLFGASLEARDIAVETFHGPLDSFTKEEREQSLQSWECVLYGFAQENNEGQLLRTVDMMRAASVPLSQLMKRKLVAYFAQQEDLDQAKHWYHELTTDRDEGDQPQLPDDTLSHLLKACALGGDHAFGHQVVASLLKEMPNKEAWDAIFLWSAAIGKGVDEIDRMMNVMIRRNAEERQKNPSIPVVLPDIDTINALVEFCMSRQDPYAAERYIALGEKRGIFPNEKTFTMQILYRLSVQDIDGARAAYFNLQGNLSGSPETITAVNQLLQALCRQQRHHFDEIMGIVDDLHERKAHLAPETVAALCVLHLRRGEWQDALDLLRIHAYRLSPEQRAIIRKKLTAFIFEGGTSTADAWDAYQITRNTFPEMPREDRIPIMNEFFTRKRSDMACHVFFHMRNHTHETIVPNREVYVAAFTGFARNADAESLELVHNQLKLDLNVELDTQLRNALMLAYAATENNRRALEFWAEIAASAEGPTYNSIAIAFRSCEGMPFGDGHAKSLWNRLKRLEIDIDKQIFTAYLGAIARNHLHDEALALVESVEDEYGFTPDLSMSVLHSPSLLFGQ